VGVSGGGREKGKGVRYWIMAKGSSRVSAIEVTLEAVSDFHEGPREKGKELPFDPSIVRANYHGIFYCTVLLYPSQSTRFGILDEN